MNAARLAKYAGALMALEICSACGGSGVAPSSAGLNVGYVGGMLTVNGRPVTAARLSPMPRYATILPERHEKKTFEYVFNTYGTYASIFDYPKSDHQIGSISGDGGQGCTNVLYGYGKKIFWNIGGANQITEYRVPHTPIKTLSVTYSFPTSCAMNTSGDLAVGVFYESGAGGGDVLIFKNASGSPTVMTTPLISEYFDGYDKNGNLFADGYDSGGNFRLVELPKGSSKFITISINNKIRFPGSVQWDGKYVTVFDQLANKMYRYDVHGTSATLKNTITLTGAGDCAQTWIATGVVYCGDSSNNNGEVFNFPAGGSPIAAFTGNFVQPLGVVAAEK